MAEGLRDPLDSRNSATTKHLIWKLESRAYCVALFVWSYVYRFHTIPECDRHTHRQTDGQTDTRQRHVPRLVQHRAVKINHIALHTKQNYQAASVG